MRTSVIALLIAACSVEPFESSTQQAAAKPCTALNCRTNSDLVAALGPYELDETGVEASSRGFRIVGTSLDGDTVTDFHVEGTSVFATNKSGKVLTGDGVVGLTLTLEQRTTNRTYDLVLDSHIQMPFYVDVPGSPASFSAYYIKYDDKLDDLGFRNLCPNTQELEGEDVDGTRAVLWKGDRYDPDTGAIFASDAAVGSWFNLSCEGEAWVHTLSARTGGAVAPNSPVAQRQATHNFFTAAYCGPTGLRYTTLGQPIRWSDLSGPHEIGNVMSYEAVWDETGARCLSEPRLTTLDKSTIGCRLLPCSEDMIDKWSDDGWLVSGNRFH